MKLKIKRRITTPIELQDTHPILQRVYAARGIQSSHDLEYELKHLHPYTSLLGIERAAEVLTEALVLQKKILIVGDFDADGATSSALAVSALKTLGAQHVEFLVPNRFEYGYGLTPEIVEVAATLKPDLIITVDNGIASNAGVDAANQKGIQVLVTDHHLPGSELPKAVAIVNPNQHGDVFPSKNLAGVGVIFYVMLALRAELKKINWFETKEIPEPNMAQFLDLVALGTVADVVPLDKNNRILVHQGLKRIRAGQCRSGILALLEVAKRDRLQLSASDLGFSVAPRLNAAGRLDDMSLGINCLLCTDQSNAKAMAQSLDELNRERRSIEKTMKEQAIAALEHLNLKGKNLPMGLCLFDESWHQGVIGILASRIKDEYYRPVIVFALANDHELKGSARSIPGLHIRDLLDEIATKHPELMTKFGGHAMAAGLTLNKNKLSEFAKVFDATVKQHISEENLMGEVLSDGELTSHDLSLELAEHLRIGGPWGQHFPEPLFDGKFKVVQQRLLGGAHLKMTLSLPEQPYQWLDAIAFNVDDAAWPNPQCQYIHATYRLDINEYQDTRKLQLIVEHFEPYHNEVV